MSVQGEGVGPYVFKLESSEFIGEALVELISTSDEGSISDYAEPANLLESISWSYEIDPDLPTPKIRINEIHAANLDGLKDEDGDAEDWVEIWNYGDTSVRLLGWTLTDDSTQPEQWAFPDMTINAGSRLVVFASGKNRSENTFGSRLHTNFKLGSNGETISLFKAESPPHLVDSMSYPEQRNNISFGYVNDLDSLGYFQSPTPGQPNKNASFLGVWPEPDFNAERGYYDNPVNVYMTSLPGSEIRFTLDGSATPFKSSDPLLFVPSELKNEITAGYFIGHGSHQLVWSIWDYGNKSQKHHSKRGIMGTPGFSGMDPG